MKPIIHHPWHRYFGAFLLFGLLAACDLEVIPDDFSAGPDTGQAPLACFTVNRSSCTVGDCNLQFDAACSEGAVTYRWDFNDDFIFDREGSGESAPSFNFTVAGTYTVRLEIQDNRSRTDDTTMVVTVNAESINTFEQTDPAVGAANGLALLSGGGFLLTGKADNDLYIRRISEVGSETLNRTFSSGGIDAGRDIAQLSDGNYIAVGGMFGSNMGQPSTTNAVAFRTRPDGVLLNDGNQVFEDPNAEELFTNVLELSDGRLVLAGHYTSSATNNRNIYLGLFSSTLGLTLFLDEIVLPDTETPMDIVEGENCFYVVGSSLPSGGNERGFLAKFDLVGNTLELTNGFPKYFSGDNGRSLVSIERVATNRFRMIGQANRTQSLDVLYLETDGDGNLQAGFPTTIGDSSDEYISDAKVTADGGTIIAGRAGEDALLLKLNASGDEIMRAVQEVNNINVFQRVMPSPDGGYYVAGYRGASLYYGKTDAEGGID